MTGHVRGDVRKRLAETGAHYLHPDPDVRRIIERERRAAAVEALRSAASEARWMEYPASQDPRHWAIWLNARADRIGADS